MGEMNDEQLKRELSFDLYGRYATIRDIINHNRNGTKKLRIIDVGSRANMLKRFFPNDDTFYLDPFTDSDDKNFIKGDGCAMPFEDESFDWVVSADVFEHVPKEKRDDFLNENIRVTRLGTILVAPFWSKEVEVAEIHANENYKILSGGEDHRWLKEHIENGLPDSILFEEKLKQKNIHFQKLHNNRLFLWQALIAFNFLANENLDEDIKREIEDFNYFYNTKVFPFDNQEPSYRKIYFIKKDMNLSDLEVINHPIDSVLFLETIKRGLDLITKTSVLRKNSQIANLNNQLEKKDNLVSITTDTLNKKEQEFQDVNLKLQFIEGEKSVLNEQMRQQEERFFHEYKIIQSELIKQVDVLNQKDILLREREEENKNIILKNKIEMDHLVEKYTETVSEKDVKLSSLQENLKQQEKQQVIQVSQIESKDQDIVTLRNQVAELSAVVSEKTYEVALMSASKFWRLRDIYMHTKWAIRNPLKFSKKHIWSGIPTYPQIKWAIINPLKFIRKYIFNKVMPDKIITGYYFSKNYSLDFILSHIYKKKINKKFKNQIDIIIPVYSTEESFKLLEPLFDSIYKNTTTPYRLIVIDDNSPYDQCISYLEKISSKFNHFILIKNKVNEGFVSSVNKGISKTKNHFVILNTDTEVPFGWLERLMTPIFENNTIATTTPFTNSGTIFSFPKTLENNNLFLGKSLEYIDSKFKLLNFDYSKELFCVPTGVGFCMGINYKIFKKIGGFNNQIFTRGYGEENDFCMRANKEGYRNILVPNLFVYHKHGGTFDSKEKQLLLETNILKVTEIHPEYNSIIKEFIQEDPFKLLRNFIITLILLDYEKTEVIFDHALGGGANYYLNDYINRKSVESYSLIIIKYIAEENIFNCEIKTLENNFQFKIRAIEVFFNMMSLVSVKKIIVNNLVSYLNPIDILQKIIFYKKENPNVVLEMKVHDYFCISPNYVLVDKDNKFRIESTQSEFIENNIRSEIPEYLKNTDIMKWRNDWIDFIENCSEVEVFSESTKKILQAVFDKNIDNKIIINPHKVSYINREPNREYHGGTIHVAILGNINEIKGLVVLESLVIFAEENNIDIMFHLFGFLLREINSKKLINHGTYKREQLPELMEDNQINLVFIPSIWPETFSYTTEEAIVMNIPLLIFDIGASPERVSLYEKGSIIPLDSSCETIISAIENLVNKFSFNCSPAALRVFSGRDNWFINEEHKNIFEKTKEIPGWQEPDDSFKLYEMGYFFGDIILEIGTFGGRSAVVELLGAHANKERRSSYFFGVDVDPNSIINTKNTLQKFALSNDTLLHQGDLKSFVNKFQISPTMVFVDGDHLYEGVSSDLSILSGMLENNVPVLCHDYMHPGNNTGEFGVRKAVDEFVARGEFKFLGIFGCSALLLSIKKPQQSLVPKIITQISDPSTEKDATIALFEKNSYDKKLYIDHIEVSSFWKLRNQYFRIKWAILNPLKFIKKYFKKNIFINKIDKINYLYKSSISSLHQDGFRIMIIRIKNYILYGKGKALINKVKQTEFKNDTLKKLKDLPHKQIPIILQDNKPLVSIIIPVFNQIEYTLQCLKSIAYSETNTPFEIIIIDDNSSDSTRRIFSSRKDVRYFRNKINLGFVGSCNYGAQKANGKYLFFLNNDTVVLKGWLDSSVEMIQSDLKIGLIGSKLIYPDGKLQEAGGIVWSDGNACNYGRGNDPTASEYNFVRDVDYCSGAAILVSSKIFKNLGGFDTRYSPAYYEDTDLAFSIRKKGFRTIYNPFSEVIHFEGMTAGTDITKGVKSYQVRNKTLFLQKWEKELSFLGLSDDKPRHIHASRIAKKRILILDQCTPTPDRDSGSIDMFNTLYILKDFDFHVTFFPIGESLSTELYTENIQKMGIESIYGQEYFSQQEYISQVDIFLQKRGEEFDFVFISRIPTAQKCFHLVEKYCQYSKVIFNTVDLYSLREQRYAEHENNDFLREKAIELRKEEINMMKSVDVTIVVSEVERAMLLQENPDISVVVIPIIRNISKEKKAFFKKESNSIVFVGGFRHPPNIDAVLWFCKEILPFIVKEIPEIKFHVVGPDIPPEIKNLSSKNIIIEGHVSDVETMICLSSCSVAPLRFGAGQKGKIVQSLSLGVPCVTTSIGAEGIGIHDKKECLIADTPALFAKEVISLLRDKNLWNTLSREGYNLVKEKFGIEKAKKEFKKILK